MLVAAYIVFLWYCSCSKSHIPHHRPLAEYLLAFQSSVYLLSSAYSRRSSPEAHEPMAQDRYQGATPRARGLCARQRIEGWRGGGSRSPIRSPLGPQEAPSPFKSCSHPKETTSLELGPFSSRFPAHHWFILDPLLGSGYHCWATEKR